MLDIENNNWIECKLIEIIFPPYRVHEPILFNIFLLLFQESCVNLFWIAQFYKVFKIAFNYHSHNLKGKEFFNCYSKIQIWIKN